MNEDVVNMEIRKFLKKVGITSQREIEKALQEAEAAGTLAGSGPLQATMTLEVAALGLVHTVDGEIAVE
jgi:arginine repressor